MARRARGTNVSVYLPREVLRVVDANAHALEESRSSQITHVLAKALGIDLSAKAERRGTP